ALQAPKSRQTTDDACGNRAAVGFFFAPDGSWRFHQLNWRKLLESVSKPVRPQKVFAQLSLESAFPFSPVKFLFACML
ncbi:MAG: hypothetical protein IJ664_04280, partial [Clostridia bacterium]|nr:hypothetical protein [Clostridia bacterium]